jgi:hypothetical protein
MPETSIVRKIYKWKPFTGRTVERPKYRWEDDVGNDLRKMKLMKWAEQVQDRRKWKDIVEKAKTLTEFVVQKKKKKRRMSDTVQRYQAGLADILNVKK